MKHWHETAGILERVAQLHARGERAAIATVVRISGSAYRRPGAKLLVERSGASRGGISGGCLESDVRSIALEVLEGAPPRMLHYDTGSDEEMIWGLGLGCGGAVDLHVAPADPKTCASLQESFRAHRPFAVVSLLPDGAVLPFARGALQGTSGSAALDEELVRHAAPLLAQGTSALVDAAGRQVFVDVLRPPPQLTIFGAGDDAQPLSWIATQAGFEVTVVDHRPAYLTEQRFPGVRRVLRRPGDGVDDLQLGPRHFAVVQTHALVHDRDWVAALLPLELAYIGMLGPRARSEQIMAQLGATFPDRVFAPVGLDLGADGPEQVAVSIVAEMLAVQTGREPGHLRGRKGGIHG